MCCRAAVEPFDRPLAELILGIGMFHQKSRGLWVREIPEEGASVQAHLQGGKFTIAIYPAVQSWPGHFGKRDTAGVYFEIAARYAEKVGGRIVQHANIEQCMLNGKYQRVLADYPQTPLQWENVCAGFKAVLLGDGAMG